MSYSLAAAKLELWAQSLVELRRGVRIFVVPNELSRPKGLASDDALEVRPLVKPEKKAA